MSVRLGCQLFSENAVCVISRDSVKQAPSSMKQLDTELDYQCHNLVCDNLIGAISVNCLQIVLLFESPGITHTFGVGGVGTGDATNANATANALDERSKKVIVVVVVRRCSSNCAVTHWEEIHFDSFRN
jgi:hypothetical protein